MHPHVLSLPCASSFCECTKPHPIICPHTQEELRQLRRRDAALQMQLADRNLEALELRRELASAASAADPSVVQLKQLMLDPAVAREFARLRSELEAAQAELATAREELAAVTFTQESKVGRQLMAKCRSLQEENEEMGRELAEGKAHLAEAAAALARSQADDMRAAYQELEDHCLVSENHVVAHSCFTNSGRIAKRCYFP
ncbi:hypothetical protein Vafri_9057 [Volvox africanus]|uniref:Uncharacterized protein n=1 Tax=Volvox africanus TaxID=51714 RepID=A0A8J4EYL7_9CHLO|nr:hypothetical protein Vafri_9057 [Volvox africanus]